MNLLHAARPLALPVIAIACIAAPLAAWRSAAAARDARDAAESRLLQVAAHASELDSLKTAGAARAAGPASGDALAAKLTTILAARAMSPATMVSLIPQSEPLSAGPGSPPGAPSILRHRAQLTLAPLTLPQFGSFLEGLRRRDPEWTVTSVELSPDSAAKATPGADLPLRAQLALESITSATPVTPAAPPTTGTQP